MDTLVLVDVQDSHGMMISRQRLALRPAGPPLVIGRDLACDIVLNDPYVAARHATLSLQEDGSVSVDDLATVNRLIVGDERVTRALVRGPAPMSVQVGHSHLRIRLAAGTLAPERPDRESLRSRHREYGVVVSGVLLCLGFAAYNAWTGSPDGPGLAFATAALPGAGALLAWFASWVLLSRAVRSRWQLSRIAAITLGAAAVGLWLHWAADVVTFASGVARAGNVVRALSVLVAIVAIYLHLRTSTRLRKRHAAALAGVVPLFGAVAWVWFQSQQFVEDVNRITPTARLFPPAWSRQRGVRLDKFFEEAEDLKDVADRQRTAKAAE